MLSSRATTIYAAATNVTLLGCSAAATPVYRLYQQSMNLSQASITIIFASYAIAVLIALLTVGSLSDYVGRRPVIFLSLLINLASLLFFLYARSFWDLIWARVLQGVAVGAATTALGAMILDTDKPHAPTVNSLTNFIGLAVGAFMSGVLVSFAPHPTEIVFELLGLVTIIEIVLLFFAPETTQKRAGAAKSLVPKVIVPPHIRAPFGRVSPVNIAAWAIGGFYLSLMPALITSATGIQLALVGATAVACLMTAAGVTVVALSHWDARKELIWSSITIAAGVVITLAGIYTRNVPALFLGTIIAGVGFGAAFSGGLRSLLPLASSDERAGVLATYFVESYVAFGLPAIIAGFLTQTLGLTTTAYLYGAVLVVLSLISLIAISASNYGSSRTKNS